MTLILTFWRSHCMLGQHRYRGSWRYSRVQGCWGWRLVPAADWGDTCDLHSHHCYTPTPRGSPSCWPRQSEQHRRTVMYTCTSTAACQRYSQMNVCGKSNLNSFDMLYLYTEIWNMKSQISIAINFYLHPCPSFCNRQRCQEFWGSFVKHLSWK